MKTKRLLLILCIICFGQVQAQTTLSPGDLAIVLANMDNPDEVSIVVLTPISSGTKIYFTDNGWQSSGSFRNNEGTDSFTFSSAASCGDIISLPVNRMALSTSGDQILIYQGSNSSPTFITALNVEGSAVWQSNAASASTSALPTGLTNGVNAIAVNEDDNVAYTGPTSGTVADIRDSLFTASYYTGNSTTRQSAPTSFSLTGGSCVLPVELIDFKATKLNQAVQLSWMTASELNNNYFDVQKSANGIDFVSVAEVAGAGTTNEIQTYDYIDFDLWPTAFYRLKQVDFDGQFEYSSVISTTSTEEQVSFTPNSTGIEISNTTEYESEFKLITTSGQEILSGKLSDRHTIDTQMLVSGVYIIAVYTNGQVHYHRFVK